MLKFLILVLSLPKVLLFNLRYLPFKQAVKLPIFIKFDTKVNVPGRIVLQNNSVRTAMIRIGFHEVPTKDVSRAILNIKGKLISILKGACVPSDCVIAAHSTITQKQFEKCTIIAGAPAKSMKKIGGWKL